jgi:predicted MFS family arabinose efflux permease
MTDSQVWVGLVNGLPAVAMAFFALWGGVLADRSSPRAILLRTRLTLALGALLTAFLASVGVLQVWHILILSFLIGGITGMDLVAYRVSTITAVGKDRLLNALTLSNMARNLANILGPSLGGILLAHPGAAAALWVVAAGFVLALLAMLRIPHDATAKKSDSSPLQDLAAGFRYAARTPHVRWLITLGAAAIIAVSFFPLLPVHVRDILGMGPEQLGLLMGSFGAGGLAGACLLMTRKDVSRKGLALVLMSAIWSLGLLGLAVSHNLYFSAGCLFVIGLTLTIWLNNLNTLLQTTIEPGMQGRVFSLNKVMMQLPMAWLIGGLLSEGLGYFGTLALGGGMFLFLHLMAYWRTPELRNADAGWSPR